MESRLEKHIVKKNNSKKRIQALFFRVIHFIFKTYSVSGSLYLTALFIVTLLYKDYLHQEPPFDYQLYLTDDNLMILLSIIITSIAISGFIALLTGRRKRVRRPVSKTEEKRESKRVHRRRRNRVA